MGSRRGSFGAISESCPLVPSGAAAGLAAAGYYGYTVYRQWWGPTGADPSQACLLFHALCLHGVRLLQEHLWRAKSSIEDPPCHSDTLYTRGCSLHWGSSEGPGYCSGDGGPRRPQGAV